MDGYQEALARIAKEAREKTGSLNLQGLDLTHLPAEIATLTHLRILNCCLTQVSDLSPLEKLTNLQNLDCEDTQVSDLRPLQKLTSLQVLYCSRSEVSDLVSLQTLRNLQTLSCNSTQIGDLSPLQKLTNLRYLDCSGTGIDDLSPLQKLIDLQNLFCSRTRISDLSPLQKLTNLQTLYCWSTQVSDLSPLEQLTNLETLYCSLTGINDLSPLQKLTNLQTLCCGLTGISNLGPIEKLSNLQTLDCYKCAITSPLRPITELVRLKHLIIGGVPIQGIPTSGVLSDSTEDNCLERLRAYFADLGKGKAATDAHIKLLILGNGGVGKTQITNRLCDDKFIFNSDWDSTHGIRINSAKLPAIDDVPVTLSVWDFGGQDIYHGTHSLFLNSPAIQLLVWDKETEKRPRHGSDDQWFRDYPLRYWLSLVRLQGPANSPIIPVQSKCDSVTAEGDPPHVTAEEVKDLPFPWRPLSLSTKTGHGWAGLTARLGDAARWMRDPRNSHTALIGQGWEQVRADLRSRPETEHLMSMEAFRHLCKITGMGSDPTTLLSWLNGDGTVFYRDGFFDNQIVLNQQWALDAIYALFDRENGALTALRQAGGRFTRDTLARLVWQKYSPEEQELFLSMMVSCGICFKTRTVREMGIEVAEYIAPDLLPDHASVTDAVARHWRKDEKGEWATLSFPILHGGLIRSILSAIGGMTGGNHALYWNRGVLGLEGQYKSRFVIEQEPEKAKRDWTGKVTIRTQGGDAKGLLSRLLALTYATIDKIGLKGVERQDSIEWSPHAKDREADNAPLNFLEMAPQGRNWAVSYAWGEHEFFVDCLCDAAKYRKIEIMRDKARMGLGDSISAFMNQLSDGERVFIVLSDKYLRSTFCMLELAEIWSRCNKNENQFLSRVCLWTMPDAKIHTPEGRADYAIYWKGEYERLNALVETHGKEILGRVDQQALENMRRFYLDVGDILTTLVDRIYPRTWADMIKQGFDEPETCNVAHCPLAHPPAG